MKEIQPIYLYFSLFPTITTREASAGGEVPLNNALLLTTSSLDVSARVRFVKLSGDQSLRSDTNQNAGGPPIVLIRSKRYRDVNYMWRHLLVPMRTILFIGIIIFLNMSLK
jgi:hypothetical protein